MNGERWQLDRLFDPRGVQLPRYRVFRWVGSQREVVGTFFDALRAEQEVARRNAERARKGGE